MNLFHSRARRVAADLHQARDGAVMVWVSAMIFVLMGFIALAIDGGRFLSLNSNMQQIADAAALAGAKRLDGSKKAIENARLDALNYLANSPEWSDIASSGTQIADVKFSDTTDFSTPLADDEDQKASFIQVTTKARGVKSTFSAVLGGTESYAQATAVARVTYSVCKPVQSFLCNPYETSQTSEEQQGKADSFSPPNVEEGDMFLLGNGSGASEGSWGYIDNAGGNTAADLEKYWAAISPTSCTNLQVGQTGPFPDTGADTGKKSVAGMNVRFDNPSSNLPSSLNIRAPVVTDGFVIEPNASNANCASTKSATADFKYKKSGTDYTCKFHQTDDPTAPNAQAYRDYCNARNAAGGGTGSGGADNCSLIATGVANDNRIGSCPLPRDRDLRTSGNAWDATTQGTGPTLEDLQAYWYNHHKATYPTDPTTNAPVATRYKLYLEEIKNLGNSGYFNAPGPSSAIEPSNPPDSAAACQASTVGDANRRVINVAIVDCEYWKLTGKSTRLPNFTKNATFFMTEPATSTGGASDQGWIYGEFIRSYSVNEEGGSIFQNVDLVK